MYLSECYGILIELAISLSYVARYSQLVLYRTRLYRNAHIPDREFQSRTETAHSMFCTVRLFGYTGFLIYRTLNLSPNQQSGIKSN